MNNTCTEEAEALHNLLDKKIEEYLREAIVVYSEVEVCNEKGQMASLFDFNKNKSEIDDDILSEQMDAFYDGFLYGYLAARLGIQAEYNPYNWQYLGKKYVEIIGKQETQEQEVQHV